MLHRSEIVLSLVTMYCIAFSESSLSTFSLVLFKYYFEPLVLFIKYFDCISKGNHIRHLYIWQLEEG